MTMQPEAPENTQPRDGELRRGLGELLAWADVALDGDGDRQYIAEHMFYAVTALMNGDELPERPF